MAKKNQEHLEELLDAVSRFKKIKVQDQGDNEIFSKELDATLMKLLKEEDELIRLIFAKPSKSSQIKTETPEHKGTSLKIKVNEKDGKPK